MSFTSTVSPEPASGTGACSAGTIAGGGIVTLSRSPVLMMKSPIALHRVAVRQVAGCSFPGPGDTESGPPDGHVRNPNSSMSLIATLDPDRPG